MPNCQFSIKWINERSPPVSLVHRMQLVGAKEPFNFVYLEMPTHNGGMKKITKSCTYFD